MLRTIHSLSIFFFYLLGASFFLAYVLLQQKVGGVWPAWWMQVADLPLGFTAVAYAGISLYESVRPGDRHSWKLASAIGFPLVAFFVLLLVLNFWPR